MSKATLNVRPAADLSKLDRHRPDPRDLARRLRDGPAHDPRPPRPAPAPRWTWYLDAARKRFGAWAGGSRRRPAGSCSTPAPSARPRRQRRRAGAPGLAAPHPPRRVRQPDGHRPLSLRHVRARCATRLQHGVAADPLASVGATAGLRVYRAQRRREVARAMAQDRPAMERSRFGLTVVGVLALREAEAARATA